jgi:hypothetical protein
MITIRECGCTTAEIVALATLLGCQPGGPDRPHTALGPHAEELRAAFNADSGKVRVVMLVAPT